MQEYTPKDPRIETTITCIRQAYNEIDKIKLGLSGVVGPDGLLNNEQNTGGGRTGSISLGNSQLGGIGQAANSNNDDEKGVFSGIKDMFTSFSVKNGNVVGFGADF